MMDEKKVFNLLECIDLLQFFSFLFSKVKVDFQRHLINLPAQKDCIKIYLRFGKKLEKSLIERMMKWNIILIETYLNNLNNGEKLCAKNTERCN
nr:uncharacterized protein LOC105848709 isoform X2 [Hydra vulgaris]